MAGVQYSGFGWTCLVRGSSSTIALGAGQGPRIYSSRHYMVVSLNLPRATPVVEARLP